MYITKLVEGIMLNKNVKVLRPKGTKIYKQRECRYVYHVTGSTYKKEKQYVVESRICVGKMIDDEYMNPNNSYYKYYPQEIELIEEVPPKYSDALQIGTTALLFKIIEELGIKKILHSIHGENHGNLIQDLICYMIICQTSVMQHYPAYAWNHLTSSNKRWSDCDISEFFQKEIRLAQIEQFLTEWNTSRNDESDIYISYDSTNINTRAEGIDLAEYGHAKDDSSLPQVNLSYAVNHDDGTPLFYELYPGSIIDNSQCTYMVDKAKEYGYKNIGLILDRGYFSMTNIKYFDKQGYHFIMMIKKNVKVVKSIIEEVKISLQTKVKYYLPEHGVYGITKQESLGDDITIRYFHIFYDNIRGNEERNQYLNHMQEKEKKLAQKVNGKTEKEELVLYKKQFNLKYNENGYLESYEANEKYIQDETDKLGFFVLVTSKEMTASEVLDIYRKRDSIEKLFRVLKTSLEYGTLRVHSQASLEGKTYITFLAGIIRNEMQKRLKKISEKDKKNFTVHAAVGELEKIMIIKNNKNEYVRRYGLTAKQKKILVEFAINDTYLNQVVCEANESLVM